MLPSGPVVTPAPPLKLLRVARGWRQADLAATAGIARETICRIERGRERPQLETAMALARALGRPVDDLFNDGNPSLGSGASEKTATAVQGRNGGS
jgi:putative transcriptional regulator